MAEETRKLLQWQDRLACPDCRGNLRLSGEGLRCFACARLFTIEDGVPILLPRDLPWEVHFSADRWSRLYQRLFENRGALKEHIRETYKHGYHFADDLLALAPPKDGAIFLELGCGPALTSLELVKAGYEVVGIDISKVAVRLAQKIFGEAGFPGLFVVADVRHPPFRSEIFDLSWGSGVIEHFRDPAQVIGELARITKPGGFTVNTVPVLSLGSLTWRQRWGNIPDLPLLRPLAEFVHLHLLGGRHMRFGYELSFTPARLADLFREAGFGHCQIAHLEVDLTLEGINSPYLRRLATSLEKFRPFWAMVRVVSRK